MAETNINARLEMFCDGIFAIAITILILDIKVPPLELVHSLADVWGDVGRLWPSFFAFSLSFTVILISWEGHHNLLKVVDKTSPLFHFANGFFMFTVVFIPFPTAFMAEYLNTPYAQAAIVFYCCNNILHSIGWNVLERSILKPKLLLKDSVTIELYKKTVLKGTQRGFFIYLAVAILAWWLPYVALVISVLIWIYWLYIATGLKQPNNSKTAEG